MDACKCRRPFCGNGIGEMCIRDSFRIGEKKLRKLAEENLDAGWVIVNGNRIQIKRKQFEKIIDTLDTTNA